MSHLLKQIDFGDIRRATSSPVDAATLSSAAEIVHRVRDDGLAAVHGYAEQFAERTAAEPLLLDRDDMSAALSQLDPEDRQALERAAKRIRTFAEAQRQSLHDVQIPVPGGIAGHRVEPIESAGCYAPAGRYPLPSSVLMTAIPARVAGCHRVVVASPGAHPVALAAASIADADSFLAIGGAHAIASLAFGFDGFEPVDVISGPGNRWVTAAKQLCSGVVGIDMLAGPSELLILADETADPAIIAADLLAQAEHDPDARALLVTTDAASLPWVEDELASQLDRLDTAPIARQALQNGFVCVVGSREELIEASRRLAPEHLEVMTRDPSSLEPALRNAGAVFVGESTAEVLGDYGIGPNHTLPTGGTARFSAGLSVFNYLRTRTYIEITDQQAARVVYEDTHRLANLEGLSGHAASAAVRLRQPI